jgi:6-phosphofructokinase 1
VGILTAGGDTPGLNAALRAFGKTAIRRFGMKVIGFREGFRGLVENRFMELDEAALSGILTLGGTLLGASRDKPHRMERDGKILDLTGEAAEAFRKNGLDVLVCIGGGGTQKVALRLSRLGIPIVTLPKTIDNDISGTDACLGFDTALSIATEAVDRLHSTAHSHHRIVIVETMGHRAGWLALGAGLAGGADVILIPERPYRLDCTAEAVLDRCRRGKPFSIVALAEGAMPQAEAAELSLLESEREEARDRARKKEIGARLEDFFRRRAGHALTLAGKLEKATGLESRVTVLGHLQRGGAPSALDRLLAARLGSACAEFASAGNSGVMAAARGDCVEAVPLDQVAGRRRTVPLDHAWIRSARNVGTAFGE